MNDTMPNNEANEEEIDDEDEEKEKEEEEEDYLPKTMKEAIE